MNDSDSPGLDGLASESLEDPHVRRLLEQYVLLSGASLTTLGPKLQQLVVPSDDRTAFGRRSAIRLAFSTDALHEDESAELAIVGSAFVNQLVAAIRRRGTRVVVGRLGGSEDELHAAPRLPFALVNGYALEPSVKVLRHRIGRLTAKMVIRAGAEVKEFLADSALFDLCTGAVPAPDIVTSDDATTWEESRSMQTTWEQIPLAPTKSVDELLPVLLRSIEDKANDTIATLSTRSSASLQIELARIRRYYESLISDAADPAAITAFKAEHERRTREETERHRVKGVVHPIQLAEWEMVVQRADWHLKSKTGHEALYTAQRALTGKRSWILTCPRCGQTPQALAICHKGHASCDTCSQQCSVCQDYFCGEHGIEQCHIDGQPACSAHAYACDSCQKAHCSSHRMKCDAGNHFACSVCVSPCAHCGRLTCERHAAHSRPDAPKGARKLCPECVRACEGGTGEIVGPDEVADCASCDKVVCEHHQARCAVDGLIHCSSHLRRADRSRRLLCEQHRVTCAHEPNAVLGSDEVVPCASCQKLTCSVHSGTCVADDAIHCLTHLKKLSDMKGSFACEVHRTACHIDGEAFSQSGTRECPVCARLHCKHHTKQCSNCFRSLCTVEFRRDIALCATCRKLSEAEDVPDHVHSAVARARKGSDSRIRGWRLSQDARHIVAELDLGWSRRLVVAVPHEDDRAEFAVSHSLFGSRKLVQ